MGTYSKVILSGSTDGQGIAITGLLPSIGNTLHTAITGAGTSLDEIWLYAYSGATTAREIKLAIGPTTATGSRYTHTVTADDLKGLVLICPGLVLRNAAVVKGYVTVAHAMNIFGYVNRFAS